MAWSIVRVSKGSGPHGGPSSNLVLGSVEIRPFRLSETTKICGGQSIVTMRLSAWTTTLCEGYFHITLLFKGTPWDETFSMLSILKM